MIAKCSRCQNTFTTERYGRQTCPSCGAEVLLPAPGEDPSQAAGGGFVGGWQPPGGQPPPGGDPSDYVNLPQDQDAPWDARHKHGGWKAFVDTVKASCLEPTAFFARLKTSDTMSAFWWGWICAGIGGFFTQLWSLGLTMIGVLANGGDHPEELAINVVQLAFAPLGPAIGLWIGAGITHLMCMLFKCSDKGFDATFRAVAYSQGPQLLAIVPFLGAAVGGIWTLVLYVIAISRMQRTTVGRSAGAVLAPIVLICGCLGCIAAIAFGMIGAAAGSRGAFP